MKDGADNGADVAIAGARDVTKVGNEVVIDEVEQFIACQSLSSIFDRRPVLPAIGRGDDRFICLAQLILLCIFKVVKILEEEQPGELREAVGVAGEPGILAQKVAYALDRRIELFAAGEGGLCSMRFVKVDYFRSY